MLDGLLPSLGDVRGARHSWHLWHRVGISGRVGTAAARRRIGRVRTKAGPRPLHIISLPPLRPDPVSQDKNLHAGPWPTLSTVASAPA